MKKIITTAVILIVGISAKAQQTQKKYTIPYETQIEIKFKISAAQCLNFIGYMQNPASIDTSKTLSANDVNNIHKDHNYVMNSLVTPLNEFLKADRQRFIADSTAKAKKP